ncbi:MAG TPA: hypothetical protein VI792_05445 [Candidatus Eisenbacteria bacterium]
MITRLLRALIWLASIAAAVAFAVVVARAFDHPAPASPLEGALLDGAQRLIQHRPLYADPLTGASPTLMPGFPVVLSVLAGPLGVQLWIPRVLTVVATVLVAVVVLVIVRAETLSWTFAAAGFGSALAGCGLLAGAPDLARPEMLMLLLALAGFAVVRFTMGPLGAVLAAMLLTAACVVHLAGVWFLAAALLYIAIEDHPRLFVTAFALALTCGGGYVALSSLFGPWFNFVAWDLPLHSLRFDPTLLLQFVGAQLLGQPGVLVLATVLSFALPAPPWRGNRGLWVFMGFAMLGAGLLATQGASADPGYFLPGVVVMALLGPVSMERITRHLSTWPGSTRNEGHGVALVALALQFIVFSTAVPAALASLR